MAPKLVACPACACYVRREEESCPHCGAALARWNGRVPATAAALLLGLSAVGTVAVSGCSDDDAGTATSGTDSTGPGAPAYGVPETVGGGNMQGGMGGTASTTGGGEGGSTSSIGGTAPAYGVPETTSAGAGGAGGN